MCTPFAATYPERPSALVMAGSYARRLADVDYPWGMTEAALEGFAEQVERDWGTGAAASSRALRACCTSRPSRTCGSAFQRMSASPAAAAALFRMNAQIDSRAVLPAIRVPKLNLHRTTDQTIDVGASRYMARQIPGARPVELPRPRTSCPGSSTPTSYSTRSSTS